uniref:Uncharacterized protein n=1 Tax=Arundo donax TaxID=35708 RepID=A0A0A8Z5E2_ARUDO
MFDRSLLLGCLFVAFNRWS